MIMTMLLMIMIPDKNVEPEGTFYEHKNPNKYTRENAKIRFDKYPNAHKEIKLWKKRYK